MKMTKLLLSAAAASLLATSAVAGPKLEFNDGKSTIEIFNMVQVWGMSTLDAGNLEGTDYAEGSDIYIRRGRIGVKGKYDDLISYKVWFAYDNLGKSDNNILMGTGQLDSNKEVYIWDAYFTYKFDKEFANVTIGYFRPQVGKESITSGFTTTSYEKGLSNFYVRTHLVGRGPGREVGVNIGGLTMDNKLNYNFGVFGPNHAKITGDALNDGTTTIAEKQSLLFAGRVAYSIGDSEMKKYKLGYKTNYFGKRKGVTVGVDYAYQGENDQFKSNSYIGADALLNWGALNASVEYNILEREQPTGLETEDKILTAHLSYNMPQENGTVIEPAVMYTDADIDDGSHFKNLNKEYYNGTAGSQTITSVGVNWYRNKFSEKYGLHAAFFDKDDVSSDDGEQAQEQTVVTLSAQYTF